jgi:hypothetical protein
MVDEHSYSQKSPLQHGDAGGQKQDDLLNSMGL